MVLHLSLQSSLSFCMWCEKVVQSDSSACSCPVFLTSFIEEAVFSPLYMLASFVID